MFSYSKITFFRTDLKDGRDLESTLLRESRKVFHNVGDRRKKHVHHMLQISQ